MKQRVLFVPIYFFSFAGFACVLLLFSVIAGGLVWSAMNAQPAGLISAAFRMEWLPQAGHFGILPMIAGTLLTAVLAVLMAMPLSFGILCCIWIYDNHMLRGLLRFMSGIPTVVYGFCGLFILIPLFRALGGGSGFSMLLVAVVLCFLILPTMTIIADSALHALLRQGNLMLTTAALGLGKEKAFLYVALYTQRRWMLSAVLLAFGRALGDTLIALMLSGNTPVMPEGIFSSVRTLSGHISLLTATEITPEIEFTLFLAGCLLFAASLGVSLITRLLKRAE